jgi:hypothetical protein
MKRLGVGVGMSIGAGLGLVAGAIFDLMATSGRDVD